MNSSTDSAEADWLDRALPLVRTAPYDRSFRVGTWKQVIGLDQEYLLVVRCRLKTKVPAEAFEPDSFLQLRTINTVEPIVDLKLADVNSISVKRAPKLESNLLHFTVDAKASQDLVFEMIPSEAAHFIKACRLLFGERFQLHSGLDDSAFESNPTLGLKPRRILRAATRSAHQPRCSKWFGNLLFLLGYLLFPICPIVAIWLRVQHGEISVLGSWRPEYVLPIVCVLGLMCLRVARQLKQPDAKQVLARDARKHVFYLRSFDSDGQPGPDDRAFASPITSGAMIGLLIRAMRGKARLTWEEEIARELTGIGPFVAIGRPGERLAPTGAARLYLADDEWQRVVLDMVKTSQAVVLQIELTAGTWWEFEQCVENLDPQRLLILFDLRRFSQQRYEEYRLKMETILPIKLPRTLDESPFVCFDKNWLPQLMPLVRKPWWTDLSMGSRFDMNRTLAAFLEGF